MASYTVTPPPLGSLVRRGHSNRTRSAGGPIGGLELADGTWHRISDRIGARPGRRDRSWCAYTLCGRTIVVEPDGSRVGSDSWRRIRSAIIVEPGA